VTFSNPIVVLGPWPGYTTTSSAKVNSFFPADHTHTNLEGAKLNAAIVAKTLKKINPGKIKKYMTK